MSKKWASIALIVTLLGGGGTVAAVQAKANEAREVTVQSFAMRKAPKAIPAIGVKKGKNYCSVKVKHVMSGQVVTVPALAETCKVIKTGQEIQMKVDNTLKVK